jgi:geranylgeranyl reductase family protein
MISIIGAGPVGNYLAFLLAKNGRRTQVFEKNKKIGIPVQCTGIVSNLFKKIIKPRKEFVINEINKTKIYSPDNKFIELKIKTNFILDRTKFDCFLAEKAKKNGVKYYLNHKFLDFNRKDNKYFLKIKHKNQIKIIKTDYLIGSDGPLSQVGKRAKIFKKRDFFIGTQVRARYNNKNIVEFFPFIGEFAWIVPENKNIARIGVASYKKTNIFLERFLENLNIEKEEIIDKQAGLIPIYNRKIKTQKNKIFVVGDAAAHVKATTGGGIVLGLIAAESLAEAIVKGKNYDKLLKKKLGKELYAHLIARKIMDKFKEKDWNELIKLCKQKKIKKLLFQEERDNLIELGIKMVLNEPKFLKFGKFLI